MGWGGTSPSLTLNPKPWNAKNKMPSLAGAFGACDQTRQRLKFLGWKYFAAGFHSPTQTFGSKIPIWKFPGLKNKTRFSEIEIRNRFIWKTIISKIQNQFWKLLFTKISWIQKRNMIFWKRKNPRSINETQNRRFENRPFPKPIIRKFRKSKTKHDFQEKTII